MKEKAMMAEFEGFIRAMMEAKRRGIPADEVVLVSASELREKEAMAEQLRVTTEGELVILTAEGEDGKCEMRLRFDEVERFEEALDKARKKVGLRIEKRRSHEATKVHGVDDEDFEEAE